MDNTTEDNVLTNKAFTLLFISIYRDLPTLWKIKSKDYMNKHKRNMALKEMRSLLRMYGRSMSENEVKRKINILRTSFRREARKVKKSMVSGADEVYVPTLWYYKELEFLRDHVEGELNGISTMVEQEELLSESSSHPPKQSFLQPPVSSSSAQLKKEDLQRDILTMVKDRFRKPDNEYEVMARNWAFKLERMSAEQRRLAEKFINEILFEGEEGNLHRHSVVINPPVNPSCQYSRLPNPSPTTQSPFL